MPSLIPAPPQPPSLTPYNTYTTWPGGVDPTASVFRTDNQKFGGSRKGTRKNRKDTRKDTRKGRKASRKDRKDTRKERKASREFSFF
jgi:hypothetical protein